MKLKYSEPIEREDGFDCGEDISKEVKQKAL